MYNLINFQILRNKNKKFSHIHIQDKMIVLYIRGSKNEKRAPIEKCIPGENWQSCVTY